MQAGPGNAVTQIRQGRVTTTVPHGTKTLCRICAVAWSGLRRECPRTDACHFVQRGEVLQSQTRFAATRTTGCRRVACHFVPTRRSGRDSDTNRRSGGQAGSPAKCGRDFCKRTEHHTLVASDRLFLTQELSHIMSLPCPRRLVILALLTLTTLPLAAHADEPAAPKNLHLYLLIGQSNMAGRGPLPSKPLPVHPRVLMLNKANEWVPASEPLHFDKTIAAAGIGASFAQTMADASPDITIGLIPCAVGGTPLSRWQKDGDLYNAAVTRLKIAQQSGTLKGILWHQGESDSGSESTANSYAERCGQMIRDLRHDAGTNAPFVAGELGRFLAEEKGGKPNYWKRVNEQLHSLPSTVPLTAVVSSAELTHHGDQVHFGTESLRIFGKRYAAAMQTLHHASPTQ